MNGSKTKVIAIKVVGTIASIFMAGLAVKYPNLKEELLVLSGALAGWLHLPQPQTTEEKTS